MGIDLLSLKNGLLEHVASRTDAYISAMPKEIRKAYGQFFTSKEAASFMASLFVVPEQERITVLDAGAGSGILTAALVQRLSFEKAVKSIEITCYDTDENVLP
ncbi:MAG: hypothetical protein IJ985_01315, partial [Akkermansia sp.]|nr:hypothetical protein [Akkermansia sp.]